MAIQTINGRRELMHSSRHAAEATIFRLATLFTLADGAWAAAVYKDERRRQSLSRQLRVAIEPVPLIELSLKATTPDPLGLLQHLPPATHPAPVVSFTDIGSGLPALYGYLDLEREALAKLPHHLLFWLKARELHDLARHAPNFYSRLSGVFLLELPGHVPLPHTNVTAG